MKVELSVGENVAKELLLTYEQHLLEVETYLSEVRSNVKELRRATGSGMWQETTMPPSSGGPAYTVRFYKGSLLYVCDCPSFRFASGLDMLGRCKHIRSTVDRRVFT